MLAIMSYLYAEVRLFKFVLPACVRRQGGGMYFFLCIDQSIGSEKNLDWKLGRTLWRSSISITSSSTPTALG